MYRYISNKQANQAIDHRNFTLRKMTHKFRKGVKSAAVLVIAMSILASLPYGSSLSLPNSDPAPGRSPGPPHNNDTDKSTDSDQKTMDTKAIVISDTEVKNNEGDPEQVEKSIDDFTVNPTDADYDETTVTDEVTETTTVGGDVSSVVSERDIVGDACAFARTPSSSGNVVTLLQRESDVDFTVHHVVFDTDELVRGIVYEVRLQHEGARLRDFVIYSTVDNYMKGNFTPTTDMERSCREQEPLPYFVPKHNRSERSKHGRGRLIYRQNSDHRTKPANSDVELPRPHKRRLDSELVKLDRYYFRDKIDEHDERSVLSKGRYRGRKSLRFRKNYAPARIVSGPFKDRGTVVLQWTVSESTHFESVSTSVIFRLRYRKTTSTTVYQVFFTKLLRLDCAIKLKMGHVGRISSGHLPRGHGCKVYLPRPTPQNAILLQLHKLNVPCSKGSVKLAINSTELCGKLEQIPAASRKYFYTSNTTTPVLEVRGRPMFAASFRQVDSCHDVVLTERSGSFEVGPTDKIWCSYKIHLPYGNQVAIRLQMGNSNISNSITPEDLNDGKCKGMAVTLEYGDSRWKHCSKAGDPQRNFQFISDQNTVRLNISVLGKKNGPGMWLKLWWMDKPVDEVVGKCDYGWVTSGGYCMLAFREVRRSWMQAENECKRQGGHLASILNAEQQHIVDQLLIHTPGSGVEDLYWVGATDAGHEGEFRWSDGRPFSYAHWFPGWQKHNVQPNDDGLSWQDCVELRREFPPLSRAAIPTFMWNDRACTEKNYYVCEKPLHNELYNTVLLHCNDTITLNQSRNRMEATISSPDYPHNYPDDVNCITDVFAPPSHTLRLEFEELVTEHEPHCNYDYLEIIELGTHTNMSSDHVTDADWYHAEELHPEYHMPEHFSAENEVWEETESQLPESDAVSGGWARNITDVLHVRRLCGDWSAKLKLLRYTARSNHLRLRFHSDHSRHHAGFRAKISAVDAETCADGKQVMFNGECYLFAGHPQASWATAKQVCEGLHMQLASITSAEEERFIITGVRQSADYNPNSVFWLGAKVQAPNDQVMWLDGSESSYQGWPPYNDTKDEEADEESCLGIKWKSSPVPSQPSHFYWVTHKCSTPTGYVCKRRFHRGHTVQNKTIEDDSGDLFSPNYPAAYENNIDYWVHVTGPEDTRLVFVFSSVDLEMQKDCLYDFVELRDPEDGKSSRFCGKVATTKWVSSSNRAVLHFHSDYSVTGKGYALKWHSAALTGCPSQTFTAKEGTIASPNFPDFLLPNLDCTYNIIAPTGGHLISMHGRRVFLNISYFDFGRGVFENGVPLHSSANSSDDASLEVQVDNRADAVRPFRSHHMLSNGLFVSNTEVMKIRLKTAANITGRGFIAYYKTVSHLNTTNVLELRNLRLGRLSALNWPAPSPPHAVLRTRILAPHNYTLSVAFARTILIPFTVETWPCGEGKGWIEVKDSYADSNGTRWMLCEVERAERKVESGAPVVIKSYLNSLTVTQSTGDHGIHIDGTVISNKDMTHLESCYPNPCLHGGYCASDDTKNYCSCIGHYTGAFCLLNACDRAPCAFGNCSLSSSRVGGEGFDCLCSAGWRGRRCNERIRPCATRPCNNRGACSEKDGNFLCQCNPSWKGKRCEVPNPNPNIVSLGTRMIQEPFWLGLIAVFLVLGLIGLIWCAKRHFPEKIEKLLAEEADRCARPAAAGPVAARCGLQDCSAPAHRTLLTRLGIRKPSVLGLSAGPPRAARTFSLDDLLKPPPRRTPSPRKKRNNSTPTKKNAAEKKQILQQLISPATANDHSKKITMGELIQMSEKKTLSTVESAPAFIDYGLCDNKETSFASEASSPSTSPSMRHISDPKLEKKVTFARLLNKVSAEMSSSSEVDMVNTIAIPMAVIADRRMRAKASSTPPSPGVEVRSPHSTSSNQGSDSMSSLDLNLAHAALRKYSRTPKISSADSILAMFRNFSTSSAAMASRASSGGVSASSTPSASSPQDDTVDADDISLASSYLASLAPDSPVARPHNTIEVQVLDPLSANKSSSSVSNLLHPPSILLEVPTGINKCLSPIRELPTPLPTPMPTPLPTPLPSPRMPRAQMESDLRNDSIITCLSPSEDELDEITVDTRPERPTSGLRLKLRQHTIYPETSTPSTHVTDSPSPQTHSQDSEREMSPPSPAPNALCVPMLTIERPSPGSPPPRRTPPHLELHPPPLITITYNASEESDEPLSPRPPPPAANMCYLSPFSMSARGERAPSESNLSSSGYSSMASPGPSRCGSSNPLCPSEMDDPGSGGGPSCFQSRRRPLTKTNSSPAASNEESKEPRRGRSDSETLSDDPLLESNDEGIGTDERVDDIPLSAKEMEKFINLKEPIEIPQATLCSPSGVTKCTIVKCISVERGLDEKTTLKPPSLVSDCSCPLSPVSSRSESPLSDKTGLGQFSPLFYGRQLPFTDSDGLYDFPSSECVRGANNKSCNNSQRKAGRRRDRRTTRTTSHEVAGTAKSSLPHMPHSMHNLLEVPGLRDAVTPGSAACRIRKGGRRRSRSQAPAPPSSSSSEDSVSAASVASVASARELRLPPDLDLQQPEATRFRKPLRRQKCRSSEDTPSKMSSSLDLTEETKKPAVKINKLRSISNQIRFLRRLEKSMKMKETYPPLSDDEGDESSSVTSPLLQGRKELSSMPGHAISAPLLGAARPRISRQRRYDRSLMSDDARTLTTRLAHDNSD